MRCYLVRHAQPTWTGAFRFHGRTDPPLGPEGLAQARRLAAHFAGRALGVVYHSGLTRSVQTADLIASRTQATLRAIPGLAEINFGAWDGLTVDEVQERFNGMYEQWRRRPSEVRIPGGEPCGEFRERVRRAFADLAARHHEEGCQELLVVSHGGVIASLLADWLEADYDGLVRRLVLDYAGITAVEWDAQAPSVSWINATAHLHRDFASRNVSKEVCHDP